MDREAVDEVLKRHGISFVARILIKFDITVRRAGPCVPPPKQCGVSFGKRTAEGVGPYRYAASYPPLPPKRCGTSFGGAGDS